MYFWGKTVNFNLYKLCIFPMLIFFYFLDMLFERVSSETCNEPNISVKMLSRSNHRLTRLISD